MTRQMWWLDLMLGAGLALAAPSVARGDDEDDCATEFPHCEQIDDTEIASLEVVVGRVVAISETPLCSSQAAFVTLTLQSTTTSARYDLREVYLAPRPFLERQGFPLVIGQEVSVLGISSWNTVAGELTVIEVSWDKRSLRLRDADGRLLWLAERPSS